MANITLTRLTADEREQFILDNQYAFKYGAMEEFGKRDNHFEEDGEIISRKHQHKSAALDVRGNCVLIVLCHLLTRYFALVL